MKYFFLILLISINCIAQETVVITDEMVKPEHVKLRKVEQSYVYKIVNIIVVAT